MSEFSADSNVVQLVAELGMHAIEKGWLREAEVISQALRRIRENASDPIIMHALVKIAAAEFSAAASLLESVLRDHPGHPRATVFLGFAKLREGYRHDGFRILTQVADDSGQQDPDCRQFARELLAEEFS